MTAPPPEEPDGPRDPRDLDFDAEFERIIADWEPTEPDSSVEPVEPVEPTDPDTSAEPVDTPSEPNDSLRNLFRNAWPDEDPSAAEHVETDEDPEEHFVPPPAPPIPRPEPRRLLAWGGVLGAPMIALVLLVLDVLPSYGSFFLFCWFVGGFGYLVATMDGKRGDGWDDGARI